MTIGHGSRYAVGTRQKTLACSSKLASPRPLTELAAPQVLKIVVHAATAPEPTNRRRQSIV